MNLENSEKNLITNEETDACSIPLCIYIQIFSLQKKAVTWKKKIAFFLCNFSVRTLQCFQKKNFAHKELKKLP